MNISTSARNAFRKTVRSFYKVHGRHTLPWRTTLNPYYILVSEVMLQQTQVDRVIPYYRAWIKQFKNIKTLAHASLAEVLRAWQGLGYNRRAKMLHQAAIDLQGNSFPYSVTELEALPGVGPYTARAVAAFAYNQDVVLIETNIRTVIIHHFFKHKKNVTDEAIAEVVWQTLPRGQSRMWYAALMDYGSFLKRSGVKNIQQSKTYNKQRPFKGSGREVRGAILRSLTSGGKRQASLLMLFDKKRATDVLSQLEQLLSEGLIQKKRGVYSLAS